MEDSILLPGAKLLKGSRVCRSIIGENSTVAAGVSLGDCNAEKIVVIGDNEVVDERHEKVAENQKGQNNQGGAGNE